MKNKIIIIDSDRRTERLLKGLLGNTYELLSAHGISEGYSLVTANNPDIVIIDPLFPKKEGIAFISSVREWSDCYIIALSENSTELAAVSILDAGADDYIRKPFFSGELLSKIKAYLRRISALNTVALTAAEGCYENSGLRVEHEAHNVYLKGERIHLTKNEFKILSLLCKNAGKVLTYDYIMRSVWGPQVGGDTGILRVNMTNLRRKLEADPLRPEYILTENGIGYRAAENQVST
ncbi:MAG: response regulator transcription factor [Clostridia bacterium]|nr:response regulator transcription factor [Clostridia bacterium]